MKTTEILAIFVLGLVLGLPAGIGNADFTFGTPTNLGPTVNGPDDVLGVCISYDTLELYFCSNRPDGYGGYDLWVATRPTIDDDWSAPMNLGSNVNSQSDCMAPSISADGLTLYFSDYDYGPYLPGGFGSTDIWMVTRETKDAGWSAPVNVGQPVNWWGGDNCPNISADGLWLYFGSSGARGAPGAPGWYDLWLATRATTEDEWGEPVNLGPTVNSLLIDTTPSLSSSGLVLFFCSDRAGGHGDFDIWMTTRVTKEDSWGPPVNLGPVVNSSAPDGFPSISADGSTLYFVSGRPGGLGSWDLWQVEIYRCGDNDHPYPIGDLNQDCRVDFSDVAVLCTHWLECTAPECD
jgi:Tol biopolymer transport system component